jgi:hypothetical protein
MVRTRRAARPGAGEARERDAKARTRELAFEVAPVRSEVARRSPPERSGLGTLELLRAWGWRRAFEDAKREDVELRRRLESGLAFVVAKRWGVGSRCDIRIAQGEQPA